MKRLLRQLRPFRDFTEKERRLCGFSPSIPENVNKAYEWTKENSAALLAWLTEKGVNLTGEAVNIVGRFVVAVPKGVIEGFKREWNRYGVPAKEKIEEYFQKAIDYFRDAPLVGKHLEKYFEDKATFEEMKALVDHQNWLTLFHMHPEILDTQKLAPDVRDKFIKDLTDKPVNSRAPDDKARQESMTLVLNFVEKLPLKKRQEIFVSYVDQYIPESIRKKQFAAMGLDPVAAAENFDTDARFAAMKATTGPTPVSKVKEISQALGAIVGLEVPPTGTEAYTLAFESLTDHYKRPAADPTKPSDALRSDYQNALQLHRLSSFDPVRNSPDELRQELNPSRFLGALKMGAVGKDVLGGLSEYMERKTVDKENATAGIGKKLNSLTGAVENQLYREGKDLQQVWDGLEGWQKLALIAGAIYAIKKWPTVSLVVGGAYLGRMILYNDPHPATTWMTWLRKGITNMEGQKPESIKQGYQQDLARRAALMADFLPPAERERLINEGVALGLLAETSVQLLAKNFSRSPADQEWELTIHPGSALDIHMSQVMGTNEWRLEYKQFFAGEGREMANSALKYFFYRMAIRRPENAKDADIVKAALSGLPDGTHPSQLAEHPNTQKAVKAYDRLVGKGVTFASTAGGKLGDVVLAEVGLTNVGPRPEALEKRFAKKKGEVMGYLASKYGGHFDIDLVGNSVHYGMDKTSTAKLAETPVNDFLSKKADEIYLAYQRWSTTSDPKGKDPFGSY